jgi:8-oxo-dGTP pyrophosphatase MutT (NUDIX family)
VKLPVPVRRLAYRWGYRVMQLVWLVRRSRLDGVKCVITDRDRVLLVRHTYGREQWDFPGGRIEGSEPPHSTARREMREELGLEVAEWTPLGLLQARIDHRRDTVHLFRVELRSPAMRIERGELAAARWFRRAEVPQDVAPYVWPILARAAPLTDRA